MVSAYELWKGHMSERDRKYFHLMHPSDQQEVVDAAKTSRTSLSCVLQAFESDIVGIAIADRAGIVMEANTKCLHLLGKTRPNLLSRSITKMDFLTPDVRERYPTIVDDICNKYKRIWYKQEIPRRDASTTTTTTTTTATTTTTVLVEVRSVVATGQTIFYMIDETRGIDAFVELRKERGLFEQLANAVPFMIWTADSEGFVEYYNDRWYEYTASDRNVHEPAWYDSLPAEFRQQCVTKWRLSIRTGVDFEAEFKLLNKRTGAYRWHMAKALPCKHPTSGDRIWYATCIDIHDRKTALLRSEIAEQQFQHLLDNLPIAAWGCDLNGRCTMSRGKALENSKLTNDEMLGDNLFEYAKNDPDLLEYMRRAMAGETFGAHSHFSVTNTWFQTIYSPVRNDVGAVVGMIAISLDVSDSKNREEAERSREIAKRALKANTDFVASISHEIRTPLNGIIGMADLILSDTITEIHRPYMKLLKQSGKTLLSIVNELLDLSKLNAGKMSVETIDMDLRAIIQTVVDTTRVSLSDPLLQLLTHVDPNLPTLVRGDPTKIQQIVTNLVNNAIKFTKRGTVTIRVEVVDTKRSEVCVRLSVQDTGVGFSEEFRKNMFKDFCQEDASIARQYGGTGLGLAICQKLAVLMSGTISVESEKGKGTTFTVELPLLRASAAGALKADSSSSMSADEVVHANGTIRVLVAEDNAVSQIIIERMLSRMGVACDVVGNGQEVLDKLAAGTYTMILMDCEMPVLDGFEATRHIRADPIHAAVPIIALTANAMEESKKQCLSSGMDDYLTKPATFKAIAEMIKKWIPTLPGSSTGSSTTAFITTHNLTASPAGPGPPIRRASDGPNESGHVVDSCNGINGNDYGFPESGIGMGRSVNPDAFVPTGTNRGRRRSMSSPLRMRTGCFLGTITGPEGPEAGDTVDAFGDPHQRRASGGVGDARRARSGDLLSLRGSLGDGTGTGHGITKTRDQDGGDAIVKRPRTPTQEDPGATASSAEGIT
ncbi:hypothetical protein HKX48_008662 [Thoreauomyces humboldtii]|nr:hypothetical protein HKX48_008662 [Thoreauomyces humboldtii]